MTDNVWQASIKLEFEIGDNGQTKMTRNLHYGPLVVQKPFYPEKACHIYLLHPPGGVASCDNLSVEAKTHELSHVLITTPGATKFYKSLDATSSFFQDFYIQKNSSLEYLPAQNIFYKGTKTKVVTNFYLELNAKFAFRDVSKCGMKDEDKPFENSSFLNVINIYQDGKLKVKEICKINGDEDLHSISGNCNNAYIGTYISNKVSDITLEQIRALIEDRALKGSAGLIDDYLVVRFLGTENEAIEKAIVDIWKMTRLEVIELEVCVPRIWST